MHYSAILVLTQPKRLEDCLADLGGIPGVEVYHTDPVTGRIIAVQESDDQESQQALLRRVQALATVLVAELVYHFVDHEVETEITERHASGSPTGENQ